MRANLHGTPTDPKEVLVRNIEEPLPGHFRVSFPETPELSVRFNPTKIITKSEIVVRDYVLVGVVERAGFSPVAEYRLIEEEL